MMLLAIVLPLVVQFLVNLSFASENGWFPPVLSGMIALSSILMLLHTDGRYGFEINKRWDAGDMIMWGIMVAPLHVGVALLARRMRH